jgi:hypothetical protein
MAEFKVGFLLRLLSALYVNIWIPIRLNYLRLKFKLVPKLKNIAERIAIVAVLILVMPFMFIRMVFNDIDKWLDHISLSWRGRERKDPPKPPAEEPAEEDSDKNTVNESPCDDCYGKSK